ncbi:hypothetical protein ACFFX0_00865 [Citricoccus parietis]|uniref:Uncharacterized protein n=1 Tax=Citricoccus parietis TaxID=592307 RepID=A0ABV5FT28_9MICC
MESKTGPSPRACRVARDSGLVPALRASSCRNRTPSRARISASPASSSPVEDRVVSVLLAVSAEPVVTGDVDSPSVARSAPASGSSSSGRSISCGSADCRPADDRAAVRRSSTSIMIQAQASASARASWWFSSGCPASTAATGSA